MSRIRTGVDLVYIPRIVSFMESGDTESRATKTFSAEEIQYCRKSDGGWHYHRLAARFAAKEAVFKAMGIGFSQGLYLHDVSVGRGESGEPYVILSSKAQAVFEAMGGVSLSISLTHENEYACAFVLAEFSK